MELSDFYVGQLVNYKTVSSGVNYELEVTQILPVPDPSGACVIGRWTTNAQGLVAGSKVILLAQHLKDCYPVDPLAGPQVVGSITFDDFFKQLEPFAKQA